MTHGNQETGAGGVSSARVRSRPRVSAEGSTPVISVKARRTPSAASRVGIHLDARDLTGDQRRGEVHPARRPAELAHASPVFG